MATEATTTNRADQRDLRAGGWFWAQDELMDVFLPLIGSDGVVVYIALCKLVPLAAANSKWPVTTRSLANASCVSKSSVQREIRKIVALGMVREFPGLSRRPARFELVDLKQAAAAGRSEPQRQISLVLREEAAKD